MQDTTPPPSAQDRLTRSVKDQMTSFLWAALEAQAERDAAMDALARTTRDLEATRERMAATEAHITAYVEKFGVIEPPEVTPLAPDDPSELVGRLNGLRNRTKAEKGS